MRVSLGIVLALVVACGTASARDRKKREPAASGATPPTTAVEQTALVPLTVVCATPGALIYVDGEQVAMTPMDLPVPITPGEHSIKVTRLGFAPFIDVVSTKGKKQVRVEMELVPVSGVLHVKSNVPGARVMVDGRYLGEAPLDVEVDAGPRAVQVSKACYHEFFKNVMTVAGQEQEIAVTLQDLPAAENPCKPQAAPAPRWYQKKWVWGVVAAGAVVIAGGVAAGAYLATRDPLAPADYRWNATGLSVAGW